MLLTNTFCLTLWRSSVVRIILYSISLLRNYHFWSISRSKLSCGRLKGAIEKVRWLSYTLSDSEIGVKALKNGDYAKLVVRSHQLLLCIGHVRVSTTVRDMTHLLGLGSRWFWTKTWSPTCNEWRGLEWAGSDYVIGSRQRHHDRDLSSLRIWNTSCIHTPWWRATVTISFLFLSVMVTIFAENRHF